MPKFLRILLLIIILLAAIMAFIFPLMTTAQSSEINLAELRVVNGLVGLGSVDVYLDNRLVLSNLQPEQATVYFAVPAGQHNVAVRSVGEDPFSSPYADVMVNLAPNQSQTLIAYQKAFALYSDDTPIYLPPPEQIAAFMVVNDNRSPIALGNTRLTGVHLAIGAPEVINIAYPSRASLLHQVQLEQPYGTVDLPANNYTLTVVDASTPDLDLIERVGDVTFYANTLYTLVVVPDLTAQITAPAESEIENPLLDLEIPTQTSAVRLFVISAPINPPATGTRVRIFHAAHDTAVVDVYIDERLVAPRLNYGRYTDYLGMENYSHTISLRPRDAASDSPPFATARFAISPQETDQPTWTLILLNATSENVAALDLINIGDNELAAEGQSPSIINTSGGSMVLALLPDNITQVSRGFARLRLLHALDGAANLSISTPLLPLLQPSSGQLTLVPTPTLSPNDPVPPPVQLVPPTRFGMEASEEEVPAGVYESLDILAGSGSQIISIPQPRLVEGVVYTIVVIGSPSGDPPLSYVMLEDFGRGISSDRLYIGRISVNAPSVNVRQLASDQSSLISNLPNDYEVEVLGRDATGAWIRVRYLEPNTTLTREGWIASRLIVITRLGIPLSFLELPEYIPPPETPTPQ